MKRMRALNFLAASACGLLLGSGCSHAPVKAPAAAAPLRNADSLGSAAPQAQPPGAPGEPTDAKTQTLLDQGYYYYSRGDYSRALQNLETVFLIDPRFPEEWAKYLLYYCYVATADYRSALKLSEELVKTEPGQPLGYLQVGLAQLWLGETASAAGSFRRALEFESHAPRTHFYLGLAEGMLKNSAGRDRAFADAESEYEQILGKNPKDFPANYELASLYLYWNRNVSIASRLIATAKETIIQSPDEELPPDRRMFVSYYVPLLEGILQFRKGDTKESLKTLTDSLSNAPSGAKADIAEIYSYVGRDYLALGDKETARGFLDKVLTLDPKGPYSAEMRTLISRK